MDPLCSKWVHASSAVHIEILSSLGHGPQSKAYVEYILDFFTQNGVSNVDENIYYYAKLKVIINYDNNNSHKIKLVVDTIYW